MKSLLCLLCLLALVAAGCAAPVGLRNASLPRDAAGTCASHCQEIGLVLTSVVVMADNVGCVCSAASQPSAPGAAPGGMAAIMMMQQNRRAGAQSTSR